MSFGDLWQLRYLFEPRSVLLVGASDKRGSIGQVILQNLIDSGYQGEIYPVNPKYQELFGLRCYSSLESLGKQEIDLAIIAIPIGLVPGLFGGLRKRGIKAAIVISAGGKETGEEGRRLEQEIQRAAESANIRVLGPNCMGLISLPGRLNASFAATRPLEGSLAFISQSGALCSAVLDISKKEGFGFRYFVSAGSMLDVDVSDLIYYLGHDPEVSSLVIYVEYLSRVRKFMSAARAVSMIKPIIILKAGRSEQGARAASSHTGAMAGEDAIYDAAFRRAGVVRVESIQELFDCAEVLAKWKKPMGPNLLIITNGGGPGVMAVDALSALGIEPMSLPAKAVQSLGEILPPHWSKGNPVDILGDAPIERWKEALKRCLAIEGVSAFLLIFVPQGIISPMAAARLILELNDSGLNQRPLICVFMGGTDVLEATALLNKNQIPTFESPERAIKAFYHIHSYFVLQERLQEIPKADVRDSLDAVKEARRIIQAKLRDPKGNIIPSRVLTESESKAILRLYGLPVTDTRLVASEEELVQAFGALGSPVVLKIHSELMTHKSDKGGVRLNIQTREELISSYRAIEMLRPDGDPSKGFVTIQPMIKGQYHELLLGMKRDHVFGPVLAFGMGGVLTEFFKDVSFGLPPLNWVLARDLVERTKVSKLLKGYRYLPPVDEEVLIRMLMSLSKIIADIPEIEELDMNPVLVSRDKAHIVDARIVIAKTELEPPDHLVISSYPPQYEVEIKTKEGESLMVRPIRPEDATGILELFSRLSPESVLNRFFSPLKTLPPHMLSVLTQIDYDQDMALVAARRDKERDEFIGVARIMRDPFQNVYEFRIVVRDDWQGKGIGAQLMDLMILIAAKRGIRRLTGHVLAQNTQMLGLARKRGYEIKSVDGNVFEINCHLDNA